MEVEWSLGKTKRKEEVTYLRRKKKGIFIIRLTQLVQFVGIKTKFRSGEHALRFRNAN